ncbi:hypothetical protein MD484_g8339, partial [Candolleomyces efflorescens]
MVKAVGLYASLLLYAATFVSAAIGPTGQLVISNQQLSPDGLSRLAVTAGGIHPGPLIRAQKGDRFRINVVNNLTEFSMYKSTSIHWHGLHMTRRNFADGAAWVTQCPISPGNSFLYDFSAPGQAGTFWYHSHLSTQYCDGLRGPLIIYDPRDPHRSLYDVDDESTIISLSDWYHRPSRGQAPHGVLPPIPNSTLINGRGRYPGGPATPFSIVNVRRGRRYRFRIIAMACDPYWDFSIDNHNLTIIEADGENTVPLQVDSFRIFAGQRYSAILNANQPVANYWIRSNPYPRRGHAGFEDGINLAILRYAGAGNADPTSVQTPSVKPLREVDLHALTNARAPGQPVPGGADVSFNFNSEFDFNDWQFKLNGVPFAAPNVPTLLQIFSGVQRAQDLLPTGTVYELPPNRVVELSFPGTAPTQGGPHPFHLHGHSFSVVRSADSPNYNFENPVRRDTVSTGDVTDNVTIRFVTDNAGPWFLHCHIDFHLDLGMGVVFAEDINGTSSLNRPSQAWGNLCPEYERLRPDDP